ncbi:MAG: hypothetical protein R3258_07030 [Acidimicrobiia bacterium]|nr:hypothetical protein [Acidimicrobiia bacterium]
MSNRVDNRYRPAGSRPSPDLARQVAALESLSQGPLVNDIVETVAPPANPDRPVSPPRQSVRHNLRRRLTASAASLVLILGITGMAWASQGAGPDDWNYGLSQVLVGLGIELPTFGGPEESSHGPEASSHEGNDPSESTGLKRAIDVLTAERPSDGVSMSIKEEVAQLLTYLYETGRINGREVAALAKAMADDRRPTDPGRPEHSETNGKPANPGKP